MRTMKRGKTKCICYILRRNCLVQQIIETKNRGGDEREEVSKYQMM